MNPQVTHYDLDEQIMTIKLDTGGELRLNMHNEWIFYSGPGCDIELNFTDDATKDIYFCTGGSPATLLQIVQWAENNHDDIIKETIQEEVYEDAYVREVSSPYLSGRI